MLNKLIHWFASLSSIYFSRTHQLVLLVLLLFKFSPSLMARCIANIFYMQNEFMWHMPRLLSSSI